MADDQLDYKSPPDDVPPGSFNGFGRLLGWMSLLFTFILPCGLFIPLLASILVPCGFASGLAAVLVTDGRSVCGWFGLVPNTLLMAVLLVAIVSIAF